MPEYRAKALRLAFGLGQLLFRSQWSDAHRQVVEDLVDAVAGYAAALARAAIEEPSPPPARQRAEEIGMRRYEEWRRRREEDGHGRA